MNRDQITKYLCNRLGINRLELQQTFDAIAHFMPVRKFVMYKEHIALYLYILWLIGCGLLIYKLIVSEAGPNTAWMYLTNDPKEALVYILFGAFGLIYIMFFAVLIIKFIYNIVHGGIESIFTSKWYSLAKSISYLVLLGLAFSYVNNIKMAGHTMYYQVSHIIRTSKQHEAEAAKNISSLKELFDNIDKIVGE